MQGRKDGGPLLLYLVIFISFVLKAFVLCLALCYKLWPDLKKKKKRIAHLLGQFYLLASNLLLLPHSSWIISWWPPLSPVRASA